MQFKMYTLFIFFKIFHMEICVYIYVAFFPISFTPLPPFYFVREDIAT